MLYECSDGSCLGSVMSSLLLTLITSCVMRPHAYSANSQIIVPVSDSGAPCVVLLACATWEQTSQNWLPLIPILIPGVCQQPVLVILWGLWLGVMNCLMWNLHWQQLYFCLQLPVHKMLVTSPPKTLHLKLMWAAFCCWSCNVFGAWLYLPPSIVSPDIFSSSCQKSSSPHCFLGQVPESSGVGVSWYLHCLTT